VARDLSEVENGEFDLVVNTTSLGLSEDDDLPIDLERLSHAGGVMDLVYGPQPTRLVRVAEHLNIRAVDGGEMLVQQGAVSFERWWAKSAPVEVMRRTLKEVRSSEVVG
jgi:shikimate dehydrogenase